MRALIQRVSSSKVVIGIAKDDTLEDVLYIKDKILNLRIFEDENEKMNLSLKDIKGEILAISQFTLYGDCRKGRRPNFMNAMAGEDAKKLYDELVLELKKSNLKVETGIFGADMKVDIQNDGPVTILIESKN